MSLMEVLKYPDSRLRVRAGKVDPVELPSAEIDALVEGMGETMYKEGGIGLAATQVGVSKRVVVLDVPREGEDFERGENFFALINPEIISSEGTNSIEEGCLSVPGINAEVKRFDTVKVKGLNRAGEEVLIDAEGLLSIALQHEIDHIDGKLFIDRLSRIKREFVKMKLRKAQKVQTI